MATDRSSIAHRRKAHVSKASGQSKAGPACASLRRARSGIKTSRDFAALASALMCDAILNRVPASRVNAACNAGGKLLKLVEMEYRYGKRKHGGMAQLQLT